MRQSTTAFRMDLGDGGYCAKLLRRQSFERRAVHQGVWTPFAGNLSNFAQPERKITNRSGHSRSGSATAGVAIG